MKSLKFALVAAIVVCTMISLSYADEFKAKPKFVKVVQLSYEKAIQDPGLVNAMYEQIDKQEILECPTWVYVAVVVYQSSTYRITGNRDQWYRFLRRAYLSPINREKGVINN